MISKIIFILFLSPFVWLLYKIVIFFFVKVPYEKTSQDYYETIANNINISPDDVVYDLGSGNGNLLFFIERHYNPTKLIGIEFSPWHILISRIKAKIIKSRVKFVWANFYNIDISKADIIYLFLVQPVVDQVWDKIKKETRQGTTVITLGNTISREEPAKILPTRKSKFNSYFYIYRT